MWKGDIRGKIKFLKRPFRLRMEKQKTLKKEHV